MLLPGYCSLYCLRIVLPACLRVLSNLLEPQHRRDSKVCRVLPQAFGVVRLYRTCSNYIFTGETRFAGCLGTSSGWFKRIEQLSRGNKSARCFCTRSGWFKRIEPPRTFSNHSSAELARCVELFHRRSRWFDCTEPSLATFLQGKQGLQGAYALVRCGSSASNLLEPQHRRDSTVCRAFSIYIFTGETRFAGCLGTSSLWFKRIEPPRTTKAQR